MPPLRDKNVGGLDVTMNDAFVVSGIERIGNLDGNGDNTVGIQGACRYQVFQRYAIQVLHGDEGMAFVARNFVDGADIGVIKRRCTSCFAAKTFQGVRVPGCVLRQELESDKGHAFIAMEYLDGVTLKYLIAA